MHGDRMPRFRDGRDDVVMSSRSQAYDEKCGVGIVRAQYVQHLWCSFRVWTVIERQRSYLLLGVHVRDCTHEASKHL
jgi:hypothetical protein